jgi:hypothetical protein
MGRKSSFAQVFHKYRKQERQRGFAEILTTGKFSCMKKAVEKLDPLMDSIIRRPSP